MGLDITGLGTVAEAAESIVNKIWPDKTEEDKDKMAQALAELQAQTVLIQSQIDVNKSEASNINMFVSGARPACIWVGAAALAYAAILQPAASFIARTCFHYPGEFPVIDNTILGQVLFGLLGLSGMRSFDKMKGVASK